MSEASTESFIRQLSIFSKLPADEIQTLSQVLHLRRYPAGTILFHEGDAGDSLAILVEGEIEAIHGMGTENERLLTHLKPGDFLGEMSLFNPNRQRSASARTLTDVQLLQMMHTDFEALLLRQPNLAVYIMRAMSNRLRAVEQAIILDLQNKNMQLAQALEDLKQAQAQLIEQEKMEYELALARKIQQSILPKELPTPTGWRISAYWQPAHAVGGDYYDFIAMPGGRIGILIGDATGKGIPAALVMATTCSVLRAIGSSLTDEHDPSPGKMLSLANDLLCQQMLPGTFITCLLVVLDPNTGELCFANAGHCLPFQVTAQGISELHATGMPLGMLPDRTYQDHSAHLAVGDTLTSFSDGLVEAHDPHGQMFGTARIGQVLASPAAEIEAIPRLLASLLDFTGPGMEQEDDVTLVTIQRTQG
jgi:serine phosphatase RsbU (regulator of sigma subunit)